MVDKLKVYAVLYLISKSMGLITSDSSPLLMGFYENIPTLVLHTPLINGYKDRFNITYFSLEQEMYPERHKTCSFLDFDPDKLSFMEHANIHQ